MKLSMLRWALAGPLVAVAGLLAPMQAWPALVGCSLSAPAGLTGTYTDAANLDAQGNFVVNCTRDNNGKDDYFLRVALSQAPADTMANPYPDTLNYGIYRDSARSSLWTTGVNGSEAQITLTGNTPSGSAALPAYMRVPLGQVGKAAGNYADSLVATLQLLNGPGGSVVQTLATATLSSQATVPKGCVFGTNSPEYALNYQAFQTTVLADSSKSVAMTCTKGTNYTLSLDQTTGVVPTVGLRYVLLFTSSSGASVSAVSSSSTAAQHGLTLSLPAGQAGSCSTSSCIGMSVRTITVTY